MGQAARAAESANGDDGTSVHLRIGAVMMPCGTGSQGTASCCLQEVNDSRSLSQRKIGSEYLRESH